MFGRFAIDIRGRLRISRLPFFVLVTFYKLVENLKFEEKHVRNVDEIIHAFRTRRPNQKFVEDTKMDVVCLFRIIFDIKKLF